MKISFNWLKEYVETDKSAAEVSEILTDIGLEVEKLLPFESVPGGLTGVVVGEVHDLKPHPDADRLRVATVDVGGPELLTIVCGAPNVASGQKVLVATIGSVLQPFGESPLKIKQSKIRGIESHGMICAEDELGIGESHEGIMVLPNDALVGQSAAQYLGVEVDEVFEIGLTPNRTDAFGHFGVARDLAARLSLTTSVKAFLPKLPELKFDQSAPQKIGVEVVDKAGCGRYSGLNLDRVKVAPSPAWLQNRLRAVGLSPINNVVDITNYVMLETGHPLHAFDVDKITGGKILVKPLPENTPFTTLDGVERKLHAEDLMICDEKGGMCIAGVYGGKGSGVGDATVAVFLESAWFDPVRVRKSAKRHALNTDASFRFERGVDPSQTLYALQRAAALMMEVCGARVCGVVVDEVSMEIKPLQVDFSLEKFNKLSGTDLDQKTLEGILSSLDFETISNESGRYRLAVPNYRVDVTREIDIVEEVLRIYGFNRVTLPERMQFSVSIPSKPSRQAVFSALAMNLNGMGFSEMMANGLTRSDYLKYIGGEALASSLVTILNPLSQELDVLRPNMLPGALEAVAYNLNRQTERIKLFEIGTVYAKSAKGYIEHTHLCITLSGNRFTENWNNKSEPVDISDISGALHAALEVMGIADEMELRDATDPFFSEAKAMHKGNFEVGRFGKISAKAMEQYGIKKPVFIAEINLDACLRHVKHADKTLTALPKFPSVRRDFSLLVDESVTFGAIEAAALGSGGKLLKEVGLFDVYEGKNLPSGKKSYAVNFTLRDPERTLNDKQIEATMKKIQDALEQNLGATLR